MKHSAGFDRLCAEARARIREISIEEVRRKLDSGESFHFIDVREDREWAKDHCRSSRAESGGAELSTSARGRASARCRTEVPGPGSVVSAPRHANDQRARQQAMKDGSADDRFICAPR